MDSKLLQSFLALLMLAVFASCDDDPATTEDQTETTDQNDTLEQTEQSDQVSGELRTPSQFVGSPCSCEGNTCKAAGVPQPQNGIIHGCDQVPTDWTGGVKACLQSYEGQFAPSLYFANGYCSLMATRCEGEELVCGPATFGDYDTFTSCPDGSVLVLATKLVDIAGAAQGTVYNKFCLVNCETDADCGPDEIDSELGDTKTQYACVEKSGVKFCVDPRTLGEEYTVQP
ncbi:MAG: hypothetical protein RBU37_15385 [Myxococcota bacterium]|jgi:hypothetical protein|nr:hypothetical protein [Myxococcota bacterium]